MKKFILLLSALLLITSVSFSQRNYRAGDLNANNANIKSTNAWVTYAASAWSSDAVIISSIPESDWGNFTFPVTFILHGGSCDGALFVSDHVSYMGASTFWGEEPGLLPCTDFTSASFMVKNDGDLYTEGNAEFLGHTDFKQGMRYLFTMICEAPTAFNGSVATILMDGNYIDEFNNVTHLYYPEIRDYPSRYYPLDSIAYNSQYDQTFIWSHTSPIGQGPVIGYLEAYKQIIGSGDASFDGKVQVGWNPEDKTFAVDGTGSFTGVVNLNYLNDFDSTEWSCNSNYVSGDTILGPYDWPNLASMFCKGDIISKTDGSWSANIVSIEYGDFLDLNEYGGNTSLIVHDGTYPGASTGNFKLYKNPDLTIGGGLNLEIDDGVFLKAFRGVTDPDITGWVMTNASGTPCYIYPDAAGTGLTVSTTKP